MARKDTLKALETRGISEETAALLTSRFSTLTGTWSGRPSSC